jgi:putative transposase
MAKLPRIVIPDCPHHVIQRGNRRQKVFFSDSDKNLYLRLLQQNGERFGISYLAYCLMDNHVHLIAVPKHPDSFAKGMGEAHRKYTCLINIRMNWKGYLWQGRYISYPLDEKHLYTAVRYVEQNPVRSGLVNRAEDYPWSSAKFHIQRQENPLLSDSYLLKEIDNWAKFLNKEEEASEIGLIRKQELTGRPLGDEKFVARLERITGSPLRLKKTGRKKRG